MDKKLEELILDFARAHFRNQSGVLANSLPEFKAIEPYIDELLRNEYERGQISGLHTPMAVGGESADTVRVRIVRGYTKLFGVLVEALDQAQHGKGADRHNIGGDTPFERQRMQTVSELVGSPDGMVYQAIKKLTEGMKLPTIDRQVAELLGAINYIAGIIIFLRKREIEAACKPLEKWSEPRRWQAPDDKTSAEPMSDVARSIKVEIDAGTLHDLKQKVRCYDDAVSGERPIIPQPQAGRRAQAREQTAKVDPVMRNYPIVPDTGWAAHSVADMFAVLSKLNVRLSRYPVRGEDFDVARQIIARVWRENSPLLKALEEHAGQIDATARKHAGR